MWKNVCLVIFAAALCFGCGHTQTVKVGLLSLGNLEGKAIPEVVPGAATVAGESCSHGHNLSGAVHDALKESKNDTIVDAEVTTRTGISIFENCISVRGVAFNSNTLPSAGGEK